MKYTVIENHSPENGNPINVQKGEIVRLGRESGEDDGWLHWIYCFRLNGQGEGWTPEQIIQDPDEYGIVSCDYSARELNVSSGDIVDGELKMNGWVWCRGIADSEYGWLPGEKLIAQETA